MTDAHRDAVLRQYEASLRALNACIEQCPESVWDAAIGDATFNQISFHTLLFTDLYLDTSEEKVKVQEFHSEYAAIFDDYEEWRPVKPVARYDKRFLLDYLQQCRKKAMSTLTLASEAPFECTREWGGSGLSRFELHLYNIRHIQHHVGQLAMRLRMDAAIGVPWASAGWK